MHPVPNKTENALIVPTDFEEKDLYILYVNPTDAAKVILAMASTCWGCEIPSNVPPCWPLKYMNGFYNLLSKRRIKFILMTYTDIFLGHSHQHHCEQSPQGTKSFTIPLGLVCRHPIYPQLVRRPIHTKIKKSSTVHNNELSQYQ